MIPVQTGAGCRMNDWDWKLAIQAAVLFMVMLLGVIVVSVAIAWVPLGLAP